MRYALLKVSITCLFFSLITFSTRIYAFDLHSLSGLYLNIVGEKITGTGDHWGFGGQGSGLDVSPEYLTEFGCGSGRDFYFSNRYGHLLTFSTSGHIRLRELFQASGGRCKVDSSFMKSTESKTTITVEGTFQRDHLPYYLYAKVKVTTEVEIVDKSTVKGHNNVLVYCDKSVPPEKCALRSGESTTWNFTATR